MLRHVFQFCNLLCDGPLQQALKQSLRHSRTTLPPRTKLPPDPYAPIFSNSAPDLSKREDHLNPPYAINNAAGALLSETAFVRNIFI